MSKFKLWCYQLQSILSDLPVYPKLLDGRSYPWTKPCHQYNKTAAVTTWSKFGPPIFAQFGVSLTGGTVDNLYNFQSGCSYPPDRLMFKFKRGGCGAIDTALYLPPQCYFRLQFYCLPTACLPSRDSLNYQPLYCSHQGCGSGMIYSGSGSEFIFFIFRIRIQIRLQIRNRLGFLNS